MLAHTLGNPFDLDAVTAFAARHDLWLIEDCCDAVGSTYRGRKVGTFGDLATASFYPAHHITMGEGGCVLTETAAAAHAGRIVPRLGPRLLVRSRQGQHLRQALRLAARRAAVRLRSQVHLLAHRLQPEADRHAGGGRRGAAGEAATASSRRAGAISRRLREGLRDLEEFFILPEATPGSEPSWFGFPIAVRPGAPFTRNQRDPRAGAAQDRHAPAVRRQSGAPAGVPECAHIAWRRRSPTPTSS